LDLVFNVYFVLFLGLLVHLCFAEFDLVYSEPCKVSK